MKIQYVYGSDNMMKRFTEKVKMTKNVKMIHWKENDKLGKIFPTYIYIYVYKHILFLIYKVLLWIHKEKRIF